jgi:hypothetical protein
MAVTNSSAVPQLSKDGSNLWRWENALKLYAQANAYDQLLKGTWEHPKVVVPDLLKEPTQYGTSTIPDQATVDAAINRVRQDNSQTERKYTRNHPEYQQWQAAEAALKLAILNTVPKDLYEDIMEQSVANRFTSVLSQFRDQGVTEECTVWANFFKLCASHYATTSVFTDQFKAGLAKVDKMECIISAKCKVYQFILAIEDTYPSYARDRRSDLRRGVTLSIDHMCNEPNDEARRDGPIKSAAFSARQNASKDNSNNNTPRGATGVAALDEEAVETAAAAMITTARPRQQTTRGQPYKPTAATASTHILEPSTIAGLHFPTKQLMNSEQRTPTRSRLKPLQALLISPSSPARSLTLTQQSTHSASPQ